MRSMFRSATCRCCGERTDADALVKYSTRHYAHARCALKKWDVSFFDRLTPWQASQFPAMIAAEFGLLDACAARAGARP